MVNVFKEALLLCLLSSVLSVSKAEDKFNYVKTTGDDYGPEEWHKVGCNVKETCPGYPDKLLGSIGWDIKSLGNNCEWCPAEGGPNCGQQRQSPIDLLRDRAIPDSPNWKECRDWHWMNFKDGSCAWSDVEDQFRIERHALQIDIPIASNGDVDCVNPDGERKFPKLDYSKGFPDWWYLSRTDIKIPSEHVQHGQRYAAEVRLAHFYELDHEKNKIGNIAIFMQDFEDEPSWPYLDKLICQWRKVEQATRLKCGMEPAPVYKMCELYEGQFRTGEDFMESEATQLVVPTDPPLVPPPSIPINKIASDPLESQLPLQLCQGDCDFPSDCAPGLICHRRDPFEAVPGCIGGENDDSNTDFCIFDPYGEGYAFPTLSPTNAPTITAQPTLSSIGTRPLTDFGGDPPLWRFPLGYCEGDCDNDDQCAEGLICFQREPNMAVPGCIGGATNGNKTDFCILDPFGEGYDLLPTPSPTKTPTSTPMTPTPMTAQPTPQPTATPTKKPTTGAPTKSPSASPTAFPTSTPTKADVPTQMPTYVPRPTGPAKNITNYGWEPPTIPLGECEGDCDVDDDCGPGLYCFQRYHLRTPVPGCVGGEEDDTLVDFCTFKDIPLPEGMLPAETDTPTKSPTIKPSENDEDTETYGVLSQQGWSPNFILDECQGDCDFDDDCGPGLICFQRDVAGAPVPGCLGGEEDDTLFDYCIRDPSASDDPEFIEGGEAIIPSDSPSPAPSRSPISPPDLSMFWPDLENLGWSPRIGLSESHKLKNCQGDCDTDDDCQGTLVCYQRYLPFANVPGCRGGDQDSTLTDYCANVETSTMEPELIDSETTKPPTKSPSKAPTTPPPTKPPTNPPVSIPTKSPTKQPTSVSLTAVPAPKATPPPTIQSTSPPTPQPSVSLQKIEIEDIDCSEYDEDVNFFRFCKDDSCCEDPRSSTPFCMESYSLLEDKVAAACHHCCFEEYGEHKQVGAPPPDHPHIPKTVKCHDLERAERMCKAGSCCYEDGVDSNWCEEQYELWPGQANLESICWYCCYPSIELTFNVDDRRRLNKENSKAISQPAQEVDKPLGKNDMMANDASGRRVIMREENFKVSDEDDDAYFERVYSEHLRRLERKTAEENYEDVYWWPYEWLLKVGSEYYFRYEGTQTVPPCFETVHWRIVKDPIRVAPHQMRELERLLAKRIDPDTCKPDTAGRPVDGSNGDVVDVTRPLQKFHNLHRMVFCECKDWPSKFPAERQWCKNWKTKDPNVRFYENPYNWPSTGYEV